MYIYILDIIKWDNIIILAHYIFIYIYESVDNGINMELSTDYYDIIPHYHSVS